MKRWIIIVMAFALLQVMRCRAENPHERVEVIERDTLLFAPDPIEVDASRLVVIPDTIPSTPPYIADRDWLYLLKRHELKPNTPNVHWPKFLGFCMNVYNWADTTFNGYDPEYVRGSGKKWKLRLTSDNWVDLYYIHPGEEPAMLLSGNINPNLGAYLNYMAVSVGYSVDMRSLVTNKKARHKKFDFQFSCARIIFEAHYWENNGSAFIRQVDDYLHGKWIREAFQGLNFKSMYTNAMYVFNHKKFSYGAAYNLANYQIKSAGSFFAGAAGSFYDVTIDFTQLPPDIAQTIPINMTDYRIHYNSVLLIGGYSYNWAFKKHWLFNASIFPATGITWTYSDSSDGKRTQFALSGRQMLSLTYTNRQFFATLNSTLTANLYQSHQIGFFSAIENFQVSTGVRF